MVGDETWIKGLRSYVEANRYRWVTAKTLTELMGKQNPAAAKKLEALRNHWWNEENGDEDLGTPALPVSRCVLPLLLRLLA